MLAHGCDPANVVDEGGHSPGILVIAERISICLTFQKAAQPTHGIWPAIRALSRKARVLAFIRRPGHVVENL